MSEAEQLELEEPEVEQPEQPEVAEQQEQPEPEKEPEKVEFTEAQQAVFNDAINKKVAKQREAEREAEEARKRLKEMEDQLKAQQQPQRPTVPPKPDDPYADDYEDRMAKWADGLAAQRAYDQAQEAEQRRQAQEQEAAYHQKQQEFQQKTAEYFSRGDKLGINQMELGQASQQINAFNLDQQLIDHLLDDDRGPEMAVYLSKNLEDLQAVAGMSPTRAAVYLETVVKPKSKREPPKVIPPPAETDTGSSITEEDDGISYE